MTVDVSSDVSIARPRDIVAAYAADPDNATTWYANITIVEWETWPPLVVGSRIRFGARFLGKQLRYMYEIVELQQGIRLVMRTAQGPFPMETTYVWESVGPHETRMTLRNRGEPKGFSRFAAPFMTLVMKSAMRRDLERLKALLESDGT